MEYTETTFHDATMRLSKLGRAVFKTLSKRSILIFSGIVSKVAVFASSGMVSIPMRLRLLEACLLTASPGLRFLCLLALWMSVHDYGN